MKRIQLTFLLLITAIASNAQTRLYSKSAYLNTGFDVTDSTIYKYNNASQAFTTMDDEFKFLQPVQVGTKPNQNNYASFIHFSDTAQNSIGCPLYDSTTCTFDGNNNVVLAENTNIITVDKSYNRFVYDANNNLLQQFDSSATNKVYRTDFTRQITAPFNTIEKSVFIFNTGLQVWNLQQLDSFTYNNNNNITYFVQYAYWSTSPYINDRYNYYYNANNLLDSIARETYNGSNIAKYQTWFYTRNASNQAIVISDQRWDASTNSYRYQDNDTLTYNTTTSKYPNVKYRSSYLSNTWKPASKDTYTYNTNEFLTKKVYEEYNVNNAWETVWTNHYYYSPNTATAIDPIKTEKNIMVYPNPATNTIHFTLENIEKNATASIYTIDGKLLSTQPITTYKSNIDIQVLGKGLYLLSIKNGTLSSSSKFIKE